MANNPNLSPLCPNYLHQSMSIFFHIPTISWDLSLLHTPFKRSLLLLLFLGWIQTISGQAVETGARDRWFSGSIHATNNGISLIPTFMLGKPASIFYLSVGNAKLRFEPEMRFSLQGKPWSFLFWWRYRIIQNNRFKLTLGTHPSLAFRTATAEINGQSTELLYPTRFMAGELVPTWNINDKITIGMYYLYSRGLDAYATRNTHFVTINTHISKVKLAKSYYLSWKPQLYYLRMDQKDGLFLVSNVTLTKEKSPFSVYSIINKRLRSSIDRSRDFVWNISVAYSFHNQYTKK